MITALLLSIALAAPLPPPDPPPSANPTMDMGLQSAGACALVDGASLVLTGVGGAIGIGALFFAAIAACGGGAAATLTPLLIVATVGGVMAGAGLLGMALCAPIAALAAAGYANYRNGRELWPLLVGAGASGVCLVGGLAVTVLGIAAGSVGCGPAVIVGPLALMLVGPLAVAGTAGADALFGSNVGDRASATPPGVDAAPETAPSEEGAPPPAPVEPPPMDDPPPPPPLEPPALLEPIRY